MVPRPMNPSRAAVQRATQVRHHQPVRRPTFVRPRGWLAPEQVERLLEPIDPGGVGLLVETGKQISSLLDATKGIEEQLQDLKALWEQIGPTLEPIVEPATPVAKEILEAAVQVAGEVTASEDDDALIPSDRDRWAAAGVLLIAVVVGGALIGAGVADGNLIAVLEVLLAMLFGCYEAMKDV